MNEFIENVIALSELHYVVSTIGMITFAAFNIKKLIRKEI